jgi:hypothetical protein
MKNILCWQNSRPFLYKFLSASLLAASAGYCQRPPVDDSVMIRTHMETHNRSVIVAVYGTPCAIPPPTVIITAMSETPVIYFDGKL